VVAPQLSGLDSQPPAPIPKLNRDPVWSLKPWPVTVQIGMYEWTIPALPAADWLSVLMVEQVDPDDVFPGLLEPEDLEQFDEFIVDGDINLDDVYSSFFDIIETVSGRYWWVALRLIHVAREQWHILGPDMVMRGADPTRLSLSAWLDSLLVTIIQGMKREHVSSFSLQLEAPPAGEEIAEEEMEMSANAFLSMG